MIPRSSAEYYRRQQRILARLIVAVRLAWRRMDPAARWSEQYVDDGIGGQLLMLVAAAQFAAAGDADGYIGDVLVELGLLDAPKRGVVVPSAFARVTGDGRPVESLLALAVPRAGRRFNELRFPVELEPAERPDYVSDATWESLERERAERNAASAALDADVAAKQALDETQRWLEGVVATMVIDAARAAESAAIAANPKAEGWVRMLNPPSCSRCAVLAGRFYLWNDGFLRHPRCDCRHIPASEAIAGDLTIDPDAYFRSLSADEQDRIFTKAGARAIRDGADIGQVVNARRGMYRATEFGKNNNGVYVAVARTDSGLLYTTEGATTRGRGFRALNERFVDPDGPVKTRIGGGTRYSRATTVRMMPESIYDIAENRADAIRLLRLNGFIT